MNAEELKDFLNTAYSKIEYDYLFDKATKDQKFFMTAWELAKSLPDEKSWRVLWILDHATEKQNSFIFPILDELYKRILKTKNESFIRQAMKLILRCPILEDYAGEVLERCIPWMNDMKAKISTQCLALEFFYKVCLLYPEMAHELLAYIDEILDRSPSAGYKLRLKQVRSSLQAQSKNLN
jgi:hypothetical protein